MRVAILGQPRDAVCGVGPQQGSVAIVLRALSDRLANRTELHIVAPRSKGQPGLETTPSGVRLHRVLASGRNWEKAVDLAAGITGIGLPGFARSGYFRSYARAAAKVIGELKPNIVHLMSFPQLASSILDAAPSARLVLHVHDESLARLPRALVRRRLEPFSAIVACSHWLAETLARAQPELADRIHPIGNGIDTTLFTPGGRALETHPKLLYVGRISPEKGPHVLIEAFVQLAKRWPKLELALVGPVGLMPYSFIRLIAHDPPMRSALHFYGNNVVARVMRQIVRAKSSLAEELRAMVPKELEGRILWLGTVPHDKVYELMGERTIFVQPSVCEEPFGMPLAEAMACGLPSIGTRRGGIPEIIDDGRSGRLVDPGNSAALAEAIELMLADPAAARRMGAAAAVDIASSTSWDHVAERLWMVWRAVVDATAVPA